MCRQLPVNVLAGASACASRCHCMCQHVPLHVLGIVSTWASRCVCMVHPVPPQERRGATEAAEPDHKGLRMTRPEAGRAGNEHPAGSHTETLLHR